MEYNRYTPYELSKHLSHEDLLRQFIICKRLSLIPKRWKYESLGSFWLGVHTDLPVMNITSKRGDFKACFLGYVIDPFACTYNTPVIPEGMSSFSFASFESYLDTLSGRFICIITNGKDTRIYLDASGSLSMMYSVEQEIAASSHMLIPYLDSSDDDSELIDQFALHKNNGIYPFSLTSRKTIKRLLPNHYLNLNSWTAVRHWPLTTFSITENTHKLANNIGNVIRNTMNSVLDAGFTPYMSLTAGVDSRTLLACAHARKSEINFFTWELPDTNAQLDIDVATTIAQEHKLNYHVFPYEPASQTDVEHWLHRTSVTIGEKRGQDLTSTISQMDHTQPYFAGNVSEVSRSVYWKADDKTLDSLTGEDITQRLNIPLNPKIIHSANQWLEGLPAELKIREILDLLYLEQRVGCWASEIAHGHACGPFHIYPFSNRHIFQWMLSSPDDYNYRKSKGIIKEVIIQQQPELMKWTFNAGEERQ